MIYKVERQFIVEMESSCSDAYVDAAKMAALGSYSESCSDKIIKSFESVTTTLGSKFFRFSFREDDVVLSADGSRVIQEYKFWCRLYLNEIAPGIFNCIIVSE